MESSILSTLADDGTAIVTVLGEVDFANSGQLAQRLRATVTDWSPATVRVDLAQASFIDSTGLGALIEGYQAAREAGIEYVVVNPTDGFRRVLTVTGLAEFFGLTEGETAAEVEEEAAQATGA